MQRWTEPVRVACRAGRCGCPAKGRRTRPAALTACLALACVSGSAQEGREPPASDPSSFTAEAAAVTVDVVVLDDRGSPVTGLEPEDFEIREDGRRQAIVGFEARDLTRPPERASTPNAGVTNVGAAEEQGRVMALLIDDLGISAPTMAQLAPALARWIEEHALERDEITILTTSGDRWWSDAAGRGRADLAATLESVTGKRLDESGSPGWISEWEAYEIGFEGFNLESQVSQAGRSRPHVAAGGLGSTIERVVRRYLDAGLCNPDVLRPCYGMVQGAALQVLERWRRRAETVFGAVARLSRSLAGVPGRKGVLLVTEEFVDDRSIDGPFRSAIEATQRANVAVYFLAARGLAGSSLYSAASRFQPRAQDVAAMVREEAVLATGGGEALAETTGGAVTRSNDLAAGLERMARESSAYYMLGYQPEEAPDGRWRDLEVKVAREGVRVRARRSYRASRPEDLARPREASGAGRDLFGASGKGRARAPRRELAPALLAGSVRAGLPLRLGVYVGEPIGEATAVQVVIEIDNAAVRVDRQRTPWRALLDVTVMAASVGRAPTVPVDERVDVSLGPGEVGTGWWMLSRDAVLPPGDWQIRAWVRDLGSGRSGLLTQRISVPDPERPYLSTLMLSDRTMPPSAPGEPPRLVPSAHRRFGSRGDVVCQYEVFAFGGKGLAGVPKLAGGYSLQRSGDARVRMVDPTPIQKAGERAVRRIVLPLRELEDGHYTIVVVVRDELAGRRLVAQDSFVVERTAGESTPQD